MDATKHGTRKIESTRELIVTSGAGEVEIGSAVPGRCDWHRLSEDEALALAADLVGRVERMRAARAEKGES